MYTILNLKCKQTRNLQECVQVNDSTCNFHYETKVFNVICNCEYQNLNNNAILKVYVYF